MIDALTIGELGAVSCAACVAVVVGFVAWYWSPGQRLVRRLRPVWDGAGISRVEVRERNGKQSTVRHRPRIRKRRKLSSNAFAFDVRPNPGRTVEDIVACSGAIRDALRVEDVTVTPRGRGRVTVTAFAEDPFPAAYENAEFFEEPVGTRLPIGRDDWGEVCYVNLGHTLVVGASGSGKGSVLWRYLMSVWDAYGHLSGGVQFWGVDPKRAELARMQETFERVAFDSEDIEPLLLDLVAEMKRRQETGERQFEQREGRPLIVLVIDELNALGTMGERKWQSSVRASMQQILSQGRSAGIYVVAAAQQPQKENIGPYRAHFMTRICLRVESTQEVDLVLGGGAAALGAAAHEIVPATETNVYATAGVGYVRTDGEAAVRFRAPYVDDDEIGIWAWEVQSLKEDDNV